MKIKNLKFSYQILKIFSQLGTSVSIDLIATKYLNKELLNRENEGTIRS